VVSLVLVAIGCLVIACLEHNHMMQVEVERQRISEELDEAHINAAVQGCDLGRHIEQLP